MPNPKRRHSKTRTAKRRTHDALKPIGRSECPQCHEAKLPHVDVISERLETLMGLSDSQRKSGDAPIINANVMALLEKTFPAEALRSRIRQLERGNHIDPLDLVEWLEEQGYEPEAQVTQKGEIAFRGGILDLYPVTS